MNFADTWVKCQGNAVLVLVAGVVLALKGQTNFATLCIGGALGMVQSSKKDQ